MSNKEFSTMTAAELSRHLGDMSHKLAEERTEPVDRIRKKIAFDFLLYRLATNSPGDYTLKGGYALEMKFNIVRATKDIDLITKSLMRAAFTQDYESAGQALRQRLVDHLAEPSGADDRHVAFRFDKEFKIVKGGGGGVQLSVRMLVGTQKFTEFSIDLSLEDIVHPSRETITLKPLISGFIDEVTGTVPKNEQIFTEKLHTYMRHGDEYQARTKDLVDLVFVGRKGLDLAECHRLIRDVFQYWIEEGGDKGLASLPPAPLSALDLSPPPPNWADAYARMSDEMGTDPDMGAGFRFLVALLDEILGS